MKRCLRFTRWGGGVGIVLLACLWISSASGFGTYSDVDANGNSLNNNCKGCHGTFHPQANLSLSPDQACPPVDPGTGLAVPPLLPALYHGQYTCPNYSSLSSDVANWGNGLMNGHINRYGLGCGDCHDIANAKPVRLNNALTIRTCLSCHGRVEDENDNDPLPAGDPNRAPSGTGEVNCTGLAEFFPPALEKHCGQGAGLRVFHATAGVPGCPGCHSKDPVPVGENTRPEAYQAPTTQFDVRLDIDPCNENSWRQGNPNPPPTYGSVGLDNDGDGLRDLSDPNCSLAVCGDGVIGGAEVCDDANTTPNDGCAADCTVEVGWICSGEPSTCSQTTVCGNSVVEPGEGCDDGNTAPSDGCSATCSVETGWSCSGAPSICVNLAICGDGQIDPGEGCDDANVVPNDGCSVTCAVESGWSCSGVPSSCVKFAVCGDGTLDTGEVCDDGNTVANDGCSPSCTIESGWTCAGEPSGCAETVFCGDNTAEHYANILRQIAICLEAP